MPVAPTKSTVTTSPGLGILFLFQSCMDMIPTVAAEILIVLFAPLFTEIYNGLRWNIVQNDRRQLEPFGGRQSSNGLIVNFSDSHFNVSYRQIVKQRGEV